MPRPDTPRKRRTVFQRPRGADGIASAVFSLVAVCFALLIFVVGETRLKALFFIIAAAAGMAVAAFRLGRKAEDVDGRAGAALLLLARVLGVVVLLFLLLVLAGCAIVFGRHDLFFQGLSALVHLCVVFASYRWLSRYLVRAEHGGGLYATLDALIAVGYVLNASLLFNGGKHLLGANFIMAAAVCLWQSRGYYRGMTRNAGGGLSMPSRRDWPVYACGAALAAVIGLYLFQASLFDNGPDAGWSPVAAAAVFLSPLAIWPGLKRIALYYRYACSGDEAPRAEGADATRFYIVLSVAAVLNIGRLFFFGDPRNYLDLLYSGVAFACTFWAVRRVFGAILENKGVPAGYRRLGVAAAMFVLFVPASLFVSSFRPGTYPLRVWTCHRLSQAQCEAIGVEKRPVRENGTFVGYDYFYRAR